MIGARRSHHEDGRRPGPDSSSGAAAFRRRIGYVGSVSIRRVDRPGHRRTIRQRSPDARRDPVRADRHVTAYNYMENKSVVRTLYFMYIGNNRSFIHSDVIPAGGRLDRDRPVRDLRQAAGEVSMVRPV